MDQQNAETPSGSLQAADSPKPQPTTSSVKLLSYPTHGVIGTASPHWMNIFHNSSSSVQATKPTFRKLKFDFHETYEKNLNTIIQQTPLPGLSNLWRAMNDGRKTTDLYEVDPSLPERFRDPKMFKGYGCERDENTFFRTTSSVYGMLPPTIHDVPREYHARKNNFSTHLANTGMPKNRSLNIK